MKRDCEFSQSEYTCLIGTEIKKQNMNRAPDPPFSLSGTILYPQKHCISEYKYVCVILIFKI